jgi:hypothetical protein
MTEPYAVCLRRTRGREELARDLVPRWASAPAKCLTACAPAGWPSARQPCGDAPRGAEVGRDAACAHVVPDAAVVARAVVERGAPGSVDRLPVGCPRGARDSCWGGQRPHPRAEGSHPSRGPRAAEAALPSPARIPHTTTQVVAQPGWRSTAAPSTSTSSANNRRSGSLMEAFRDTRSQRGDVRPSSQPGSFDQ